MTVLIYVNTSKQVGDADHLKVDNPSGRLRGRGSPSLNIAQTISIRQSLSRYR